MRVLGKMSSITQSRSPLIVYELTDLIAAYEKAGGTPNEAARLRVAAAFALLSAVDGKRLTPQVALLCADEFRRTAKAEAERRRKVRTWWNTEPGHA